jgi:phenylalanyl-tRNA synthetase beta chain
LDALIAAAPDLYGVNSLPVAPPVLEDIALVVPESMDAGQVEAAIRLSGGKMLGKIQLFDVYQGESIEKGYKSLAYALSYQSDETMSEKEIKKLRGKIISYVEKQLGAKLRS